MCLGRYLTPIMGWAAHGVTGGVGDSGRSALHSSIRYFNLCTRGAFLLFFVLNDQPERREGLKALLRQVHRQARIADVEDWSRLERALRRGLPDLLVIDWQMRTMTLEALRALHCEHPALSIAVLTDNGDPATAGPLLNAGALGVIPRQLEPRLILRALELVLLGGYYVPICALGPDIASCLPEHGACGASGSQVGTLAQQASEWPSGPQGGGARFLPGASASTYSPVAARSRAERAAVLADERASRRCARAGLLSPRQQQIMRLVHLGNTNKTIARALNISEGTVKIHLAAVFRLLGAANRAAAVALYNGWQYSKLQALRTEHPEGEPPSRRAMGSLVPLRPSDALAAGLSELPASDLPRVSTARRRDPLLIAAQPAWPFAPPRRRMLVAAIEGGAQGESKGAPKETPKDAGSRPPKRVGRGKTGKKAARVAKDRPQEATEGAGKTSPGEIDNAIEEKTAGQAKPAAKSRGSSAPQSGKPRRRPKRSGQ
jgi:DNA-binding NarL/FixJ family response regulator